VQCPFLLHLPDLPEGLHSLRCLTSPRYLPSLDPADLATARRAHAQLASEAGKASARVTRHAYEQGSFAAGVGIA